MNIRRKQKAEIGKRKFAAAFTLIEVMVVVAVMGLVMAMGIPSIVGAMKKEGLRKAVNDVVEGCAKARAAAILGGGVAELRFHPEGRRIEVGGGSEPAKAENGEPAPAPVVAGGGFSAQLPDNVAVEMWDVNLTEFKDAEVARVKFYPNGMCDEMTVILRSDKGEWRKITLEVTTGRTSVGDVR
ncbi:MAG: type II secretion system protein [Verrucomicrobia bacterium]|nr:type II secretion system protein [Verrucomicrobiota bacterium]